MCDDRTDKDIELLSRRDVGLAAASMGVLWAMPQRTSAKAKARIVVEQDVIIPTPDGQADCYFVHPARGKHPAVIVWTDVYGLRPAFRAMGKRLAEAGYAVLVMNPFYRSAKAPVVPADAPRNAEMRAIIAPMRALLKPDAIVRDATAFAEWLDKQKGVDNRRKMATIGYCMGGPLVMRTAAALPKRIGAVCSFHGGGLATDKPDSPHLLIPGTKARYLIAIAENDDKADPLAKSILQAAFKSAKRPAEIEVYTGAMHGWCTLDSPVYNATQAEKAWSRMLALFKAGL